MYSCMVYNVIHCSLFSVWRRGNFVQYCLLKKHYLVLLSPYFLDVNNKKIICVHLWMKKKIRKPECSMLNIMQTHCCYENIDIENFSSFFIVRFFLSYDREMYLQKYRFVIFNHGSLQQLYLWSIQRESQKRN